VEYGSIIIEPFTMRKLLEAIRENAQGPACGKRLTDSISRQGKDTVGGPL
jgi:hypothetical protein